MLITLLYHALHLILTEALSSPRNIQNIYKLSLMTLFPDPNSYQYRMSIFQIIIESSSNIATAFWQICFILSILSSTINHCLPLHFLHWESKTQHQISHFLSLIITNTTWKRFDVQFSQSIYTSISTFHLSYHSYSSTTLIIEDPPTSPASTLSKFFPSHRLEISYISFIKIAAH